MSAVAQSPGKRARGIILGILGVAIVIAAVAGYTYWRPAHNETVLQDASPEEISKYAAENPNDARTLYYYGLSLEKRQLRRQIPKGASRDALNRAAHLAKNDEQIWVELAARTNGDSGSGASFKVMDEYLSMHPNSVKMKAERNSLLVSLQRASDGFASKKLYPQAIQYYHEWLVGDPNSSDAKKGLAAAEKALAEQKTAKGK